MKHILTISKAVILVLFLPVACAQTNEHENHMGSAGNLDDSLAQIQQTRDTDERRAMMREHLSMMQTKMQAMMSQGMMGGMGGGGMNQGENGQRMRPHEDRGECSNCHGDRMGGGTGGMNQGEGGMGGGMGGMNKGEGGMGGGMMGGMGGGMGGMNQGEGGMGGGMGGMGGGMMGGMMQHHKDVLGMMQQIIGMQKMMLELLEDDDNDD